MSTRKTGLVYTLLILVSGLAVGIVIASRLDLAPQSMAQSFSKICAAPIPAAHQGAAGNSRPTVCT